jgi:hypothetical protein
MARLAATRIVGTRRICTYSDHIRIYERAISIALRCPLTPHF